MNHSTDDDLLLVEPELVRDVPLALERAATRHAEAARAVEARLGTRGEHPMDMFRLSPILRPPCVLLVLAVLYRGAAGGGSQQCARKADVYAQRYETAMKMARLELSKLYRRRRHA